MPAAIRIGDPISCGDTMAQGSGNVFVNGIPFSRRGIDLTAGHCYPPVPIISASPNVFVNSAQADRVGDPIPPHCCGDSCHAGNAAAGSPNVFVNDPGGDPPTISVVVERTFQPGVNKLFAATVIADDPDAPPIAQTYLRMQERAAPPAPPQTITEQAPPPTPPPANVPADCSDIEAHQGPFPDSFQLSPNFTLGQLTSRAVVTRVPVRANAGLTEKQIVCNLRLLCVNIMEPLYSTYGNTIQINSGFRAGAGKSQHNEGKAVDLWFKDLDTEQKRWDRANELKDTVGYDQLIYEANRSVWYHISWNAGGYSVYRPNLTNRRNVLTKPRGTERFSAGLQRVIA